MAAARNDSTWLTPSQLAKQLGVGVYTVLTWIRNGELRALNVAQKLSNRPRWRISPSAFDEFLKQRESRPPPAVNAREYTPRRKPAISNSDQRFAKNIPHEIRVKRMAILMAVRRYGQGSEWRPFVPIAVKRYAAKTGVTVDEAAVTALNAWWES